MFESVNWITSSEDRELSPLFRREFTVKKGLAAAKLYCCGLGYGAFTLNGKAVTDDVLTTPFTKFDVTTLYNCYDVTHLIKEGGNAAGAMLGNGWYNEIATTWDFEKASWRAGPKLAFQLELTYATGETETVCSDAEWKTASGPCLYNHIRAGEWWDARKERPGYDTAGFDDSGWTPVRICPGPGGRLRPAELPPIRIIRTLPGREIAPGVYDFGENVSGWARITVSGEAGDEALLLYGERLTPDMQVDNKKIITFCSGTLRHQDRYTLKGAGESETWEPRFNYHGFRYVQVTGTARVLSIEARVLHTDLSSVGEFSCSDEMLNKIHEASRRATLTNYHSVPTDCPHREQNGWTGDALISCEQALMNFDMLSAYRKWLRDFVDVQRPDGQLPSIIPSSGWSFSSPCGPAWDSAFVLIPYWIWKYEGDLSFAREFWPGMERYMAFLSTMSSDFYVDYGLGDWCPPDNAAICPVELTSTAFWYIDALAMAEMAKALGEDDASYEETAAAVRRAFRKKFVREKGRVEPESQTAYAFTIYSGLLEGEEFPAAAARLNQLVKEKGYHIDCGILGAKAIFRALSDYGYGETLYKMVTNPTCPSYAWWILQGMTTLCEQWEMTESLDHHMYSEVDNWFYRYLAGMKMDGEKLVIEPIFLSALDWVKASHRGIQVFWDKEAIEVTIPEGYFKEAVLRLDGREIPLAPGTTRVQR